MQSKLALTAAVCLLACTAQAQIRTDAQYSSFIDPTTGQATQELFGRSGLFRIAGGVVLGGSANFYLEQSGVDQPVLASAVELFGNQDGTVSLHYAGSSFHVAMLAGLACPLAKFVERDGIVAYTIPKYMDEESRAAMMRIGLRRHRVAREFDGTPFESLLRAADFAETIKLPHEMGNALSASLNNADGVDGFVIYAADESEKPIGSLINTDAQVHYHVYLMPQNHQVETSGVPLHYYWELDHTGAAGVFAVDAFAQNWAPGTHLTNLSAPGAQPTQYDIVNFYQTAGIFHQVHMSNPEQFKSFVGQTCGGSI